MGTLRSNQDNNNNKNSCRQQHKMENFQNKINNLTPAEFLLLKYIYNGLVGQYPSFPPDEAQGSTSHFRRILKESAKNQKFIEAYKVFKLWSSQGNAGFHKYYRASSKMTSLALQCQNAGFDPVTGGINRNRSGTPPEFRSNETHKAPFLKTKFEHSSEGATETFEITAYRVLLSSMVRMQDIRYDWIDATDIPNSILEIELRYPDFFNCPTQMCGVVKNPNGEEVFDEDHFLTREFEKTAAKRRDNESRRIKDTFRLTFDKEQEQGFIGVAEAHLTGFNLLEGTYVDEDGKPHEYKILQIIVREKDNKTGRSGVAAGGIHRGYVNAPRAPSNQNTPPNGQPYYTQHQQYHQGQPRQQPRQYYQPLRPPTQRYRRLQNIPTPQQYPSAPSAYPQQPPHNHRHQHPQNNNNSQYQTPPNNHYHQTPPNHHHQTPPNHHHQTPPNQTPPNHQQHCTPPNQHQTPPNYQQHHTPPNHQQHQTPPPNHQQHQTPSNNPEQPNPPSSPPQEYPQDNPPQDNNQYEHPLNDGSFDETSFHPGFYGEDGIHHEVPAYVNPDSSYSHDGPADDDYSRSRSRDGEDYDSYVTDSMTHSMGGLSIGQGPRSFRF